VAISFVGCGFREGYFPETRLPALGIPGNSVGIKKEPGSLIGAPALWCPKRIGSGARLGRMALCFCIQVLARLGKRVKEKEETKVNSPINLLIGAIVIVVLIIIILRLL
jgi:hypothetical protein